MKLTLVFLLIIVLTGCASYQANPLDSKPTFQTHLNMDAAKMPLPELAAHKFDPSDGLDMTEVAMLAVANNPELKLARDDLGIAHAQAFAAGLLPDPQLGLSRDFPQNGGPGNTSGFTLGLSYDISVLLRRSSSMAAMSAESHKTDLSLLWQEWQVVGQARLLFARSLGAQRFLGVLRENRTLALARFGKAKDALDQGNLTLDAESGEAAALQGIDRQIHEMERQISQNRHALNALLGLGPEQRLQLVGGVDLPELDRAAIDAGLSKLARHRPDLLALEAGYQAQDARFRQAILAQFPALNIGISHARDTSGLYTQGFNISMSLPIFNRNQGNIAIEKATRRRMHDEYQLRLNAAHGGIAALLDDQVLLDGQLTDMTQSLAALEQIASRAEHALSKGSMDFLAYANLRAAVLNKKMEKIALEQTLLEQRIALQTMIGGDLPLISNER